MSDKRNHRRNGTGNGETQIATLLREKGIEGSKNREASTSVADFVAGIFGRYTINGVTLEVVEHLKARRPIVFVRDCDRELELGKYLVFGRWYWHRDFMLDPDRLEIPDGDDEGRALQALSYWLNTDGDYVLAVSMHWQLVRQREEEERAAKASEQKEFLARLRQEATKTATVVTAAQATADAKDDLADFMSTSGKYKVVDPNGAMMVLDVDRAADKMTVVYLDEAHPLAAEKIVGYYAKHSLLGEHETGEAGPRKQFVLRTYLRPLLMSNGVPGVIVAMPAEDSTIVPPAATIEAPSTPTVH